MQTILTRACALLFLTATALAAQTSRRAFQPEDWYKIARVGGGTLSPDGNTLAFTVTTVIEDKNARHTEVWIQPVSGGASRRITAPAAPAAPAVMVKLLSLGCTAAFAPPPPPRPPRPPAAAPPAGAAAGKASPPSSIRMAHVFPRLPGRVDVK